VGRRAVAAHAHCDTCGNGRLSASR